MTLAPSALVFGVPTLRPGHCPCKAKIDSSGPTGATCTNGHRAARMGDELLWEQASAPLGLRPEPRREAARAAQWPEPPGPAAFVGLAGRVVDAIDPHSESDRVALLANFFAAFD